MRHPIVLPARAMPPLNPTRAQLKEILAGNVAWAPESRLRARSREEVHPALLNTAAYLPLSLASGGTRMEPGTLRGGMAVYGWRETCAQLSMLAAMSANVRPEQGHIPAPIRRLVHQPLERLTTDVNPLRARVGAYVRAHPEAPIAHEQALIFLQALALVAGAESGPAPADDDLAMMLLAANDYIAAWVIEDARPLTQDEQMMADMVQVWRFNHHPDGLLGLARADLIYRGPPQQGALSDAAEWLALQREAFGMSFEDFYECLVLPLVLTCEGWGRGNGKSDAPVPPIAIVPLDWYSGLKVNPDDAVEFLRSLTLTREDVLKDVELSDVGLPRPPTVFVRKPLLRLDAKHLLALSPSALKEQLRGGLYARYSAAADRRGHNRQVWPSTFGQLFELACRDTAKSAAEMPSFKGKLLLSDHMGSENEIEDVTVREGTAYFLFSAKGNLVRERVARGAFSRVEVVDWYEEFLFGPRTEGRRGGALRLLDANISKIRDGTKPPVPSDARLFPVLLTFDDLCESPSLYSWLDARCRTHGLLQQQAVEPVTVMTVEDYEGLMALAGQGYSLTDFMQLKVGPQWRRARTNTLLYRTAGSAGLELRLPSMKERFERVTDGVGKRLVGQVVNNESCE